jgi:hypothetical protein
LNPQLVTLADGNLQTDVSNLPWWGQLAVALGAMLLGAALAHLDSHVDSGFLTIAGWIIGVAGMVLAITVIF